VRRMTTKAQSSSELCPLSCKSVYRLCSRRKSSVRQSMQVQCQTKRASPVSNKACKSSVKQSMQVQCQTKHASPVSDKACKSSVKQSMQVQCQTKHASPVSNKACKSSVNYSMQVQCQTTHASLVLNKACNKVRGGCLTRPRGLSWLLPLVSCCQGVKCVCYAASLPTNCASPVSNKA